MPLKLEMVRLGGARRNQERMGDDALAKGSTLFTTPGLEKVELPTTLYSLWTYAQAS